MLPAVQSDPATHIASTHIVAMTQSDCRNVIGSSGLLVCLPPGEAMFKACAPDVVKEHNVHIQA